MTTQRIYNIASVIAIFVICFFWLQTCNGKKSLEGMVQDSQADVKIWRDKSGNQHAQIVQLVGSYNDLKRLNSKQDSTLRKLQALVDKHTTSATVFNAGTHVTGSGGTHISFPPSTHTVEPPNNGEHVIQFNDNPCDTVWPIYSYNVNTKWTKGTIVANKDTTVYDLKVFNEFQIKETLARDKWFLQKKQTIEIVSLNPNTETLDVKSFLKQPKRLRVGLAIGGGFVLGVSAVLIPLIYLK